MLSTRSFGPCPALLCLCIVAACGGEAKKQPQQVPPDTVVDMYTCTVSLTRKELPTYVGAGTDPDPAKAKEAAWLDACARLPAGTGAACRDPGKFTAAEATAGQTVTLTLTSVSAKITAKSDPHPGKDAACEEATTRACERAGEKKDCGASGTYAATVDEVETKKTVLSPPQ